jgi:4-hydroxy-2,2'-bipyrrole-5-carbaldehyde O-methyltransferase
MFIRPFFKLLKNNQLSATLGVNALFKPFYKICYLVAAKNSGLLVRLSKNPVQFEKLAEIYCSNAKAREALEAWLQLGIRLGFLNLSAQGYFLKGLAKKLALPENDATLALAQEAVGLHHQLIMNTPEKLQNGELWALADQDGALTARSSLALKVFQEEAIDRTFPVSGEVRLLEIGCGSGFYIKYAATRNTSLSAVGLELQPNVADIASQNIQKWNLQDRVTVETGDIRERIPESQFEIATLYNNIYYFPVDERIAVLRHIRKFIKPGGFLMLTTCCQGGNLGIEVLNLWGAATASGGRLPSIDEMVDQLHESDYGNVQAISLIPGDRFYAFKAYREH